MIRTISPILILEDTKVQVLLYCQLNSSSLPRNDCLFEGCSAQQERKIYLYSLPSLRLFANVFTFFSPLSLYGLLFMNAVQS